MSIQDTINNVINCSRATKNDPSGFFYQSTSSKNNKIFEPSNNDFPQFLVEYLNLIQNQNDERKENINNNDYNPFNYGITIGEEIKDGFLPLMVNMKITANNDESSSFYDNKFIYLCISLIQEVIITLFKINEDDIYPLLCFFLESDIWSEKIDDKYEYIKLRFQFPYTCVKLSYINEKFLPMVKDLFQKNNIFNDIHVTPAVSIIDSILEQENIIYNHACKEKENSTPLYFQNLYTFINFDDVYKKDIKFTLDISKTPITFATHTFATKGFFNSAINYEDDPFYHIPLILSPHFTTKITPLNKILNNTIEIIDTSKTEYNFNNKYEDIKKSKKIAEHLLSMIEMSSRMTNEKKHCWYDIGKCIYNIFGSNGIAIFKNCTKDVNLLKDIEDEYDNFKNNCYYDNRTLAHYARLDNEELYNEWMLQHIKQDVINSLDNSDHSISKVIYKVLWLDFIYDNNSQEYYCFINNKLRKDANSLTLKLKICTDVREIYEKFQIMVGNESTNNKNDPGVRSLNTTYHKQVDKVIKSIDSCGKKNSIINECRIYFIDDFFAINADQNNSIMSWKNGISECGDENIIFRESKLQDYVTKNTNSYFPITYTDKHKDVIFMINYFKKIHVDEELLHFFLKDQASFLLGGNNEKYFRNWIGEANASKSQYVKFLSMAFGEYFVEIGNDIITVDKNNNGDNGLNPGLARCKGCRIAIVSETSGDKMLSCDKIKKYTGGDKYYCRALYSGGESTELLFKLIHMSNVVADVFNPDEAFINTRNVIIPFQSKWVVDAPLSEKEQFEKKLFKLDNEFDKLLKRHYPGIIYLMIKYFPIYKREGIRNLPEAVVRVTNEYHEKQDYLLLYLNNNIEHVYLNEKEKIIDINVSISGVDLFDNFKVWYISAYPGANKSSIPSRNIFTENLQKKIKRYNKQYGWWEGIKIKEIKMRK